ncbi:hypothetical protein M501DRAFT_999748 [Patellaria atrata CBS 101060]|uniref:Uncharacterized protein n=1 Tax=Patellaria atrata CBS 101060 TaxID=1346257 RepID=A0A9P4S4L7_9PEZI|nr:hypothetical protein M501DRAFT_999748 [Patellaria atrata CBS 101060]
METGYETKGYYSCREYESIQASPAHQDDKLDSNDAKLPTSSAKSMPITRLLMYCASIQTCVIQIDIFPDKLLTQREARSERR